MQSKNAKYKRKTVYVSKKTGSEKIILQIAISEDAYNKLLKIALDWYPKLERGRISYTIEEIIDTIWALHTQKHTKPINPRNTTREAWNRVIGEIEKIYNFTIPNRIPNTELWMCVMSGLGIKDPRSVRGWILKFLSEGLIKPLQPVSNLTKVKMNWKFLWEIVSIKA